MTVGRFGSGARRRVRAVALLAGALSTAVSAQAWANQQVGLDISAGLALPSTPTDFRIGAKGGPELLVGARYRVLPTLSLRAYAEVISFRRPVICAGTCEDGWSGPLLLLFAGPLFALSSASTHAYLHGAVGVMAPFGDDFPPGARRAPGLEVGAGILHRLTAHLQGFAEIAHTRGIDAYIKTLPRAGGGFYTTPVGVAYWSARIGASLGP